MEQQATNQNASLPTATTETASSVSPCYHTSPPDAYHTCWHLVCSRFSDSHLPPILFQLDPPRDRSTSLLPMLKENGRVVLDYDGVGIRDFPFLPRYISVRPAAWQLEFWMRSDSRLTYRDIKARMSVDKSQLPNDNSLNMRREREARTRLGLSCWTTRRGGVTRAEMERVDRLNHDQVALNTTMDIVYPAWHGDGPRSVPVCLRSRNISGVGGDQYPLGYFLNGEPRHQPGCRLANALELLEVLWERVAYSEVSDWRRLPADQLPSAWRPRENTRRASAATSNTQSSNINPLYLLSSVAEEGAKKDNEASRLRRSFQEATTATGIQPPRPDTVNAFRTQVAGGHPSHGVVAGVEDRNLWEPRQRLDGLPTTEYPYRPNEPAFWPQGIATGLENNGFGSTFNALDNPDSYPYSNQFAPSANYRFPPWHQTYSQLSRENPFPGRMSVDENRPRHQLPPTPRLHPHEHPNNHVSGTSMYPTQRNIPALSISSLNDSNANTRISQITQQRVDVSEPASHDNYLPVTMGIDPNMVLLSGSSTAPINQNFPPRQNLAPETESFRFNGSGRYSVRQNQEHRLNTDTEVIMERNDPFNQITGENFQVSSFDNYLRDEMEE
ncbi:hypothetical protein FQN51_007247 [Onygenales sp. PD_10]|nr:hypothetical protein FQN51_007247 [Onygenales sp. PD_10]